MARSINNGKPGLQLGGPNVDSLCFVRCAVSNNKLDAGPAAHRTPSGGGELCRFAQRFAKRLARSTHPAKPRPDHSCGLVVPRFIGSEPPEPPEPPNDRMNAVTTNGV